MKTPVGMGARFGLWTVISAPISRKHRVYFLCRCDCGTEREVLKSNLNLGHTQSCGCAPYVMVHPTTKHGMHGTPEYRTWKALRERCDSPSNTAYARYGGRGITYDPRWKAFEAFYADVGPKPSPEYTLDRIDNEGNYEPGNVRWATPVEQASHTSRSRTLTHQGRTQIIAEWAREYAIHPRELHSRIERGWDIEEALTTPVHHRDQPIRRGVSVEYNGESRLLSELAREHGLDATVLRRRLERGWTAKNAVSVPVIPKPKRKLRRPDLQNDR